MLLVLSSSSLAKALENSDTGRNLSMSYRTATGLRRLNKLSDKKTIGPIICLISFPLSNCKTVFLDPVEPAKLFLLDPVESAKLYSRAKNSGLVPKTLV